MQEITFNEFLKYKPYNQTYTKNLTINKFIKYEIKFYECGIVQVIKDFKNKKEYKFYRSETNARSKEKNQNNFQMWEQFNCCHTKRSKKEPKFKIG